MIFCKRRESASEINKKSERFTYKMRVRISFIWSRRQDLTLALWSSVIRGHNSPPDCCSVPLLLQVLFKVNIFKTNKQQPFSYCLVLVEATGLEPAASCSQSRHSTKLSYASILIFVVSVKIQIINCFGRLPKQAYSCGAQNSLRLGAPMNFDRCAISPSLYPQPAAVRLNATKLSYASNCFDIIHFNHIFVNSFVFFDG